MRDLDKDLPLFVGAFVVALAIVAIGFNYAGVTREHHIQEMAKLGYCQKQAFGLDNLIWQKCDSNESKEIKQ